ncbi:hypothetical protein [Thiolapillus sp.]|uniref:hypothetical protein n=1 Tax=Thiolapillus sp. TaxID=2017437 RepID=UPI0025EFC54D|nr:hypothetical protein [Thiolapillus sp.]
MIPPKTGCQSGDPAGGRIIPGQYGPEPGAAGGKGHSIFRQHQGNGILPVAERKGIAHFHAGTTLILPALPSVKRKIEAHVFRRTADTRPRAITAGTEQADDGGQLTLLGAVTQTGKRLINKYCSLREIWRENG